MSGGEFSGKTVLITGAGGGLGHALTALFAGRGASLVLCDRRVELIGADNWPTFGFDLVDGAAVRAAAAAILAAHGAPDIVISNAGWTRAETLSTLSAAALEEELALNLTGVTGFVHGLLPAMTERGSGGLVFVSSVNALAHFGNPAYAAAKAGINAFAKAIAVECGRSGIRANVVCPGSIRTDAWAHRLAADPAIMARLTRLYPLQRIVEVDEVAEAVAFLASERASGITGVVLPVDAGLTAGFLPFIDDILGGA